MTDSNDLEKKFDEQAAINREISRLNAELRPISLAIKQGSTDPVLLEKSTRLQEKISHLVEQKGHLNSR